MNEQQGAAFLCSQTACMLAELAAMEAANAERAMHGFALAYAEADFIALPDKYGIGHNDAMKLLRGETM